MKALMLVIFSLSLVGCSSWFKKRECNKTNWFAHGEKVAMSGKRLDEDGFINECRKVEAEVNSAQLDRGFKKGMRNYCLPETAYETGRKGEKLSRDLCDGPGWRKIKAKHREGVEAYCAPENGISAGATGKKYNYICPKKLERAFLKEFNKGRKRYLTGEIEAKEDAIISLRRQIRDLKRDQREQQVQLASLNSGRSISIRNGGQSISISDGSSEEERKAAKQRLEREIRSINSDIRSKTRKKDSLEDEMLSLKRERAKL